MTNLTVTIPEEKMAMFLTAIGRANVEEAEVWITSIIRTQIWEAERHAAMNAVENPLPDP